ERVALSLWAVPALILAWLLWSQTRGHSAATWTLRAAGVLAGLYGVALTAGSALGGTDPLAPIPAFATKARELPFRRIESVADLDREVAPAKLQGRGGTPHPHRRPWRLRAHPRSPRQDHPRRFARFPRCCRRSRSPGWTAGFTG